MTSKIKLRNKQSQLQVVSESNIDEILSALRTRKQNLSETEIDNVRKNFVAALTELKASKHFRNKDDYH